MAHYAYKDVVYRADFQALCEGFEAKYGRELDPDPNYDGDYWSVVADLLEAKDAEIEALRAKLADCQAEAEGLRADAERWQKYADGLNGEFRKILTDSIDGAIAIDKAREVME